MMPASHAATTQAPMRGTTATATPATISTTPTAYIACCAVPGTRWTILGARERGQSVRTLANLSRPKTIGATVNTVRSRRNAWYAGSVAVVRDRVRCLVIGTLLLKVKRVSSRDPWSVAVNRPPHDRRRRWLRGVGALEEHAAHPLLRPQARGQTGRGHALQQALEQMQVHAADQFGVPARHRVEGGGGPR